LCFSASAVKITAGKRRRKENNNMHPKNIGTEKALQKIKHFCSYQERSHREVKEKLYGYGLYKDQAETLLSQLIEENYLNEERFAIAFAGGKFRIRQWGRVKIKYELKQRGISDYCIRKGLASIPEDEYEKTVEKLFEEKKGLLKSEKNIFIKKQKIQSYLQQKGFETALIAEYLKQL
jgi:regulatory protein